MSRRQLKVSPELAAIIARWAVTPQRRRPPKHPKFIVIQGGRRDGR
jgi:hypothetical protein